MVHLRRTAFIVLVPALAGLATSLAFAEEPPARHDGKDAIAWGAQLESEDVEVRRKAVFALWQLGLHARSEVGRIARALRDDDEYVRTTAETVLKRFEWQKSLNTLSGAIPELIEALQDGRVSVRVAAGNVIWLAGPIPNVSGGEPAPKELVPALIQALEDDDARVRANGAASLANLQKSALSALPKLAKALGDPDAQVRMWTLRALGWIDPEGAAPLIAEAVTDEDARVRTGAVEALGGVPVAKKDVVLPALRGALGDQDARVRLAAANSLWGLGLLEAIPWLTKVLGDDPDPAVRAAAASGLGGLGSPESVPILLAALGDESASARVGVASALGGFGPDGAAAVPALIERMRADDAASVRRVAANALGRLGIYAAPAIPSLIEALSSDDVAVRMMAASSLSQLVKAAPPNERLLAAALGGLDDESAEVRRYCIPIIAQFGAGAVDAVPSLIEAARRESGVFERRQVLHALSQIGPPAGEAVDYLRSIAEGTSENRIAAAGALACIASDDADVSRGVRILIDALADKQDRYQSFHWLGRVGERAEKATLFLRVWMKDERWRISAAGTLLRIGGDGAEEALEVLRAAVEESGDRMAVRLLGEAGPAAADAVPTLLVLASDPAAASRAAALSALRDIGARGPTARAVYQAARNDRAAWIRTQGDLGLATLAPEPSGRTGK